MKLDHLEKLADAHEREIDIHDEVVCELLNNEYNPFDEDNIYQAVMNDEVLFNGDGLQRIAEMMEKRDLHHLGRFIYGRIIEHYEHLAIKEAGERYNGSWTGGE